MKKLLGIVLVFLVAPAFAGQSLKKGFYSHEPAGVGISISNANSGPVCADVDGRSTVCGAENRIVVTGQENCTGTEGNQYPCTRYGYRYDYQGAAPGTAIQCKSTRKDAFQSRSMEYTLDLDTATGSIFYPSWIPYSPVDRRVLLSEVHECSYQGALLTTIEFIVSYEPGTSPAPAAAPAGGPAPGIDEPYFGAIPNACSYLTEGAALRIVRTERVQEGQANEHIDNLWSQCTFSGINPASRNVGYVFKFMLYEMFDVATLEPMQLTFNASFSAGGQEPTQRIDDLGKASFVFDNRGRTTLMVITGIQGPPDGANRPREFIAYYYLQDPDRPHARRLELLRPIAEEHLQQWLGQ
ncbi:MAG: hypothetical protein QNJ73_09670 [Gammaproteobacteria bacterium]|nr:hypothetical protein [Gammaproteobacteria bacterium]